MSLPDINAFALDAICHYGHIAQVDKAIEELAELAQALAVWKLDPSAENKAAVSDETADVMVMCASLRLMFAPDTVDERIAFKIDRQRARMRGPGG